MSGVRVLFEGAGLLAVDKPAGMLVIPGRGEGGGPSLREVLEEQLKRKVYVVHRLDRDTSGVMVFALEPEQHRTLSMAFEASLYLCPRQLASRPKSGRSAEPRSSSSS